VDDVRKENQQQKEDLLETIRQNAPQIKLISFIIDHFVPEEERIKIEEHCEWDDESCDWIVANQHLTGVALCVCICVFVCVCVRESVCVCGL